MRLPQVDKEHIKEYNYLKENKYLKCSELKKTLAKHGCYKDSEGRSHENWYSPITNNVFQVGRHDSQDVKKGTLNRILKDAGLK